MAASAILALPFHAAALPVTIVDGFSVAPQGLQTEGIAFCPASICGGDGTLFVSDGNVSGTTPVSEYTVTGVHIRDFSVPVGKGRGLHVLPNGNLLVTSSDGSGSVGEFTRDGVAVLGGGSINFSFSF